MTTNSFSSYNNITPLRNYYDVHGRARNNLARPRAVAPQEQAAPAAPAAQTPAGVPNDFASAIDNASGQYGFGNLGTGGSGYGMNAFGTNVYDMTPGLQNPSQQSNLGLGFTQLEMRGVSPMDRMLNWARDNPDQAGAIASAAGIPLGSVGAYLWSRFGSPQGTEMYYGNLGGAFGEMGSMNAFGSAALTGWGGPAGFSNSYGESFSPGGFNYGNHFNLLSDNG